MEQSTNALRRIAPEIKTMIFEYALKMSSQPRPYSSPSLLVALRAVPDLYNEALEVFYKINTFILDVGSFTGFSRLKLEAVKLVRKVALDFTDSTARRERIQDFSRLLTYPKSNLALATGVTSLQIFTDSEEPLLYPVFHIALKTMRLLHVEIWIYSQNTPKSKDLQTQMVAFLKECLANEEHMKGRAVEDRVHSGQRYLRWK